MMNIKYKIRSDEILLLFKVQAISFLHRLYYVA